MPAHFDLSPKTRHVRPQKLCCRERPAKLMPATVRWIAIVRLGNEINKIETRIENWWQKADSFSNTSSPILFSPFGNARVVRISINRSQNDIQTNKEITHFWCVSIWSCQHDVKEIQSEAEAETNVGKFISECRFSNHPTNGRQQYRFVIVIIFWMGVRARLCACCVWKRMSIQFLVLLKWYVSEHDLIWDRHCAICYLQTRLGCTNYDMCISFLLWPTDKTGVKDIYLCVLFASRRTI